MADDGLNKVDLKEITLAEATAFSEQINNLLRHNEELKQVGLMPINMQEPLTLFDKCKDGRLLCHLINAIREDTIPKKSIKMNVDKANLKKVGCNDIFEIANNNNAVIEGAKKLGCKIVNIGAEDIVGGNSDLILGLVWQLIRAYLMKNINLAGHPELIRLLKPGETLEKMMAVSAEDIIMRWFNYHLEKGGHDGQVKNFGKDMADCTKWVTLFKQVTPRYSVEAGIDEVLQTDDPMERANRLLTVAEDLDCREFTSAKDIVKGHARLNLAFTATIFNRHIGIQLPTEDEIDGIFAELEVLKKKYEDCCSAGAALEGKITSLEEEKAALKALVAQLEKQLEEKEVAVVEKDEALGSVSRSKNGEVSRLKAALAEKVAELEAQDKALATIRKEHADVEHERDSLITEQTAKIGKLKEEVDRLTQEKASLQKEMEEQHGDMASFTAKLLESDGLKTKRQRALAEHVKESNEVIQTHRLRLQQPDMSLEKQYDDEVEAMQVNLAAQEKLLAKYMADLRKADVEFEQHREAEKKRLEELNSSVAQFLGEGQRDPGDAINNMKRLLELMIEKCKKQAVQVKTLEITIEKKNQLNDVYTDKIRVIAENQLEKKRSQKKK
eukprot:comp11546_c0_seq1/m.6007 comp11546_c0_seq1/g.6007  ORF comp11546_c0_seq1/g.6007 comp11546_c0_seq1/m.6007 type:complete len:613 (-) comp11546_c0_seq1:647-2485(-)